METTNITDTEAMATFRVRLATEHIEFTDLDIAADDALRKADHYLAKASLATIAAVLNQEAPTDAALAEAARLTSKARYLRSKAQTAIEFALADAGFKALPTFVPEV